MKTLQLIALAFVLVVGSAFAQKIEEIPKGSDLRAMLFDIARPEIQRQAGKRVLFNGSLKRMGGWAFFRGNVVDKNGKPVLVGPGESSDTAVLWERVNDEWVMMKCEVGFTDVIYLNWSEDTDVPQALLES